MPSRSSSCPVWSELRKRARSNKPRFPAEIESMILDTFEDLHRPEDLTWLWVGGRHVSKHFRCEIERIFRTVLLPETILRCDLGDLLLCWDVFKPYSSGYAGCRTQGSTVRGFVRTPSFTLDRFSDNQTRAFLKCRRFDDPISLFRRLHEKQLVGAPVFSIQVRDIVNDTGLPDLHIDDEKGEVSFNWTGMLDQLLGEEHVFNTILLQRLGWHLDPGEDTPNLLETHRKLARRSRFQRECRARYRSNILDHYTQDEADALENNRMLRLAASRSENPHGNKDDKTLAVYTKQQILDEFPENAIIYSGNKNPGPKPGSIPRGILTDEDYCSNSSRAMPSPSTVDLFSPRPLPELSWGRVRASSPQMAKRKREDDPVMVRVKRSIFPAAD